MVNATDDTTHAYRKELLKNQVWQVLNFGSKAGFRSILLTPLMISRWGAAGYGLFALASSLRLHGDSGRRSAGAHPDPDGGSLEARR